MLDQVRVLLASRAFDAYDAPVQVGRLVGAGLSVTTLAGAELTEPAVAAALPGHDVLVLGAEPVGCAALCAAESLELVVRTGKGIDNIAAECPRVPRLRIRRIDDANTRAVAEYALFAMLAALRRAPTLVRDADRGTWRKPLGRELSGRTVGIVGLGLIGRDLAGLLGPFGCPVVGFDPYVDDSAWPGGIRRARTVEELVAAADVVTLHVPGGSLRWAGESFPALKPGAVLINTARGSLLGARDVADRVAGGGLFGAALDVFDREPFDYASLGPPENLLLTPHIAGHTQEALSRMAATAVDHVLEWVRETVSIVDV